MGLLHEPILKKFFSNKIESSRTEWGDYLLEIADIFSTFDGENFDRELLAERFSIISGRSPYALRDVSNFRDEFGAYGTYLGVFRVERIDGALKIFLSNAAKHFLCSTEPDVESFCRVQMALFQYPNGAGAVQHGSGTAHVQENVQVDTVREIENWIRVNPLRLLCRSVIGLNKHKNIPLSEIQISYKDIFMLMNDDRINTSFSPDIDILTDVLDEYSKNIAPRWVDRYLGKFKRNFHILERTGLFSRDGDGLTIPADKNGKIYRYISAISEMTTNFSGFDGCYGHSNVIDNINDVIASSAWGEYYDALTLPMQTLTALSDDVNDVDVVSSTTIIGKVIFPEQIFPEMRDFQAEQPRAFIRSENITDPYEIMIRREKANREHIRILNMLASTLRVRGHSVFENTFVDLFVKIGEQPVILEVKSNNHHNVLSQIRKAIAQLYEYRYRMKLPNAVLCIVLQQKPSQEWIIDYLLNDREIYVCWLVDDIRLECPPQCYVRLVQFGILE